LYQDTIYVMGIYYDLKLTGSTMYKPLSQ
jgi:hypothetical protein